MEYFGTKEIYGVTLNCTSNIEINGEFFEEGEPIISFEKIQLSYLTENKKRSYATGGNGNSAFIKWENTNSLDFQCSEGVISKTGLSLISNSKIFKKESEKIIIPFNELLTSEYEEGIGYVLNLKYEIYSKVYVRRNGEKITDFSYENKNGKGKILINNIDDGAEIINPEYVVYYDYIYNNKINTIVIGQRLIRDFLSLSGRIRVKDDQSGKETTCLIEIPKIELLSDLTMRLGSEINPYTYTFQMRGHPVGDRGNQYVCKLTFLDDDIDCDI